MQKQNNKKLRMFFNTILMCLVLSLSVSAGSLINSEDMFLLITTQILRRIRPDTDVSKIVPPTKTTTTTSPKDTKTRYKEHTVKAGDTLWQLAEDSITTVKFLKSINKLPSEEIHVGQTLKVPYFNEELLARLVHSEAGGEPYLGQVAVAAVVINRIKDPNFPDTLEDVIYEKSAFEVVANERIKLPASDSATKAVKEALKGSDPSQGSVYFYNPNKIKGWNWVYSRTKVLRIGNHVFAS